MACIESEAAKCTNKLCDYSGTRSGFDLSPLVKTVCPKCGFKTLSSNTLSFEECMKSYSEYAEKLHW